MKKARLALLAMMLPLVAGCNSSPFSDISGHYEGALTARTAAASYSQAAVHSDVDLSGNRLPTISVADPAGNARLSIQITAYSGDTLTAYSSIGMRQPIALKRDKDAPCYEGAAEVKATLCLSHPELRLEIRDASGEVVSLVLHPFRAGDAAESHETPRAFTLSQAIELSKSKSFSSRIEFEYVIQAKARMKAAYLHLLPQITIGTVANGIGAVGAVVTGGGVIGALPSILGLIGDLAPFLLPDRWFQAAAASNQAKAEEDGNVLMRLNMAVQAEGMFYAYSRDGKVRDLTLDLLNRAIGIRNEVKIREDLGTLPVGSTANMDSIVNQIRQSVTVLGQVKAEDLAAISQTLGFYEPTTVTDASLGDELVPIENAPSMEYQAVNAPALARALELDQMDYLIQAAQEAREAQYFSWLDPYGDPGLGLSFALPAELEISSSQTRELGIVKEQLQSIVSQKAFNGVTDYGAAIQGFKQAKDGMAIQESRLNTALSALHAGVTIDFFGLIGILQDYLNGEIAVESARANYRVARSQIDRLLLQGYYATF